MQVQVVDYRAPDAAQQFTQSLHETGFGVLTNHPIQQALVENIYAQWLAFFNSEEKHQFAFSKATQDGYFSTAISETAKGSTQKDIKEYFHVYPWGRVPAALKADADSYYAQANALGIFPRDENAGKNSFLSIEGGQGDPLTQLMTGAVTAYSVAAQQSNYGGNNFIKKSVAVNKDDPAAMASLQKTLSDAMNAGKFIWIGVDNNILDSFGNKVLVGSHAHFAIDAAPNDPSNSTVMVYNPWGISPQSMPAGALSTEFVSPAQYTIAELVGIAGLDFMIIEALPG